MSAQHPRVLLTVPNPRQMSLVAPIVSHFYNILNESGIEMKFFDTTFYDVSDKYINPDEKAAENFSARSFKKNLPFESIPIKDRLTLHKEFLEQVESFEPDLILVSALESTVTLGIELLGVIRHLNIPHCLGGIFATYAPKQSLNYPEVDMICVGEGETVIVPLVKRIIQGENLKGLPNIWYKDKKGDIVSAPLSPIIDIDKLPRFNAAPYDESRFWRAMSGKVYKMFPVETHRGCPLKCTFCNSPLQNETFKEKTGTTYFRGRKISEVMKDIKYFIEECGAEYLFFWADHFFTYSKKEIDEFCEAYTQYKHIPFYIQSYPSSLDEYKVKALFKVGLHRIGMGVEHGNDKFRKEIIKRPYTNEKALSKIKILWDYNIEYSCNNIVGFPYETPELHEDTIKLNKALKAHSSSCAIFTPFQGTSLRKMAIDAGFLKDPDALAPSNFDYSILDMPQFPPDLIKAKARTFNLYVHFPEKRWKDIKKAEKFTPEGEKIFTEYRQELEEIFAQESVGLAYH